MRNTSALTKQNTNYVQLSIKIAKLEKSNWKLKHANKSKSAITIVTAMTPTYPEVMGLVAQGN